jgi:hypothetical protein
MSKRKLLEGEIDPQAICADNNGRLCGSAGRFLEPRSLAMGGKKIGLELL